MESRRSRFGRIVLLNTGAFPPPYVPWRIAACRIPLLGTLGVRGLNLFARAAITMAVEHHDVMTPAVRAGLLAPYDSWANRVGVNSFVRDIPLTTRHPTWQTLADIEDRLPTLANRPIKLIWGMKDWCFNASCLERFQKLFPSADVSCIDDAGHYVIEDAHERIVPLVSEFVS